MSDRICYQLKLVLTVVLLVPTSLCKGTCVSNFYFLNQINLTQPIYSLQPNKVYKSIIDIKKKMLQKV